MLPFFFDSIFLNSERPEERSEVSYQNVLQEGPQSAGMIGKSRIARSVSSNYTGGVVEMPSALAVFCSRITYFIGFCELAVR